MKKLDMQTKNNIEDKILILKELFPSAILETSEGNKIDWDMLKQEFSDEVIDSSITEKYQMNWPGKKRSIAIANEMSNNTLRPLVSKSVDFDKTKNVYVEGDNLEVLKILQESYLSKIKCIYIDPPYNTGNDFIYNDKFEKSAEEELLDSGQIDELGRRLTTNLQSNGRFHSDWMSMMYPRLKLSRNLLRNDGVIFISIGVEELDNTIKICDEIFGASNKLGIVSRVAKTASNNGTYFAPTNDYVIVYCKNIIDLPPFYGEVDDSLYSKIEEEGEKKGEKYRDDVALYQSSLDPLRGCINQRYYIEAPDGSLLIPPGNTFPEVKKDGEHIAPKSKNDKVWRWSFDSYFQKKNLLVFKETKTSPLLDQNGNQAKYNIYTKSYLSERQSTGTLPRTLWTDFINRKGADLLKKMNIPFDFSKPYELIEYILKITSIQDDDYVLDFFSGSATTAHAVLHYNFVNNINAHFILVQLPEELEEKNRDERGFKTICDVGEERIKVASQMLMNEFNNNGIDCGFRVFKVDSSNMKDIYYKPGELGQLDLMEYLSNIKEDRSSKDLLIQVMLDLGLPLDLKIEEKSILNNTVFYVENNSLVACFDEQININIIDEICKCNPIKAVFKDSSFKTDKDKINLEERIKKLSPDTEVSIL